MQNSDIVANKTDKLFLLPNAAARLKRRDGGFDLTSAGLVSLIAACGGSSGDSTNSNPGPVLNYVDIDVNGEMVRKYNDAIASADLAEPIVLDGIDPLVAPDLSSGATHSTTVAGKDVVISSPIYSVSFVHTDNADAVVMFTAIAKYHDDKDNAASIQTNTLEVVYGDVLGNGGADDLMFSSENAKSFAIIWDYDPTDVKFKGKTLNVEGTTTEIESGGVTTTLTHDDVHNDSISHLIVSNKKANTYGSLGASADQKTFIRAFDSTASESPKNLLVGHGKSDYLAVLWNLGQYYDPTDAAVQTASIDSTPTEDKLFFIFKDETGPKLDFEKTQLFDLGDDGKEDLLVVPKTGMEIHIIWDLVSHKADTETFALSAANADNFFSIEATDAAFVQGEFSSTDLDGDGFNDLYSSYKGGIIFWGSGLAAKPTGTITLADGDAATMFAGTSTDPADGLWFGDATLEQLRDNFYFVDANNDGIRDAVSKTAKTDGDYNVWHLAGTKNVIANANNFSEGFTGTAEAITKAQLNAAGIYPDYYRKDVNDDGRPDFIAKTPNAPNADYDNKVFHNVWYAKADASFDSTTPRDAWVEIATPPAASSLAAGAEMFQLVDIA